MRTIRFPRVAPPLAHPLGARTGWGFESLSGYDKRIHLLEQDAKVRALHLQQAAARSQPIDLRLQLAGNSVGVTLANVHEGERLLPFE